MKHLILLTLLVTSCTTTLQVVDPVRTSGVPTYDTNKLEQALAASQIEASKYNQFMSGIIGPNPVSGALLQYQNYNRELDAILQNPWNGFFVIRNAWVN